MIINKTQLREYIHQLGYSGGGLVERCREISCGKVDKRISIDAEGKVGIYLSNSKKSAEAPINIVIVKEILVGLANRNYIVSKQNVIRKK